MLMHYIVLANEMTELKTPPATSCGACELHRREMMRKTQNKYFMPLEEHPQKLLQVCEVFCAFHLLQSQAMFHNMLHFVVIM